MPLIRLFVLPQPMPGRLRGICWLLSARWEYNIISLFMSRIWHFTDNLSLYQGLTLLLLTSDACSSGVISELPINTIGWDVATTCSISTGAKLSISSMSFWLAASVSSFLAHKAEKAEISSQEADTDLNEPLAPWRSIFHYVLFWGSFYWCCNPWFKMNQLQ